MRVSGMDRDCMMPFNFYQRCSFCDASCFIFEHSCAVCILYINYQIILADLVSPFP